MKYFWNKTTGNNADIDRHRNEEQRLKAKIACLESKTDDMSVKSLQVYRKFLHQLQVSKAEVVSKIGKKK